MENKFDTQLLIEGQGLSEEAIHQYIQQNIPGDCLLAVGDENLIKIHYHTDMPWKVLEYCAAQGEIFDVVVENMERQEQGLKGQKGKAKARNGETFRAFSMLRPPKRAGREKR